jgi:riboflavin transporter FmnP
MDTQIKVAIISGIFSAVVAPLMTEVVIPLLRRWLGLERREEVPRSRASLIRSILYSTVLGGIIGVILGYFLIAPLFFSP